MDGSTQAIAYWFCLACLFMLIKLLILDGKPRTGGKTCPKQPRRPNHKNYLNR